MRILIVALLMLCPHALTAQSWQVMQHNDPMDDSKVYGITLKSSPSISQAIDARPAALAVFCSGGKISLVVFSPTVIQWSYTGGEKAADATWRTDRNPPTTTTGATIPGVEGSSVRIATTEGASHLRELIAARVVRVRMMTASHGQVTYGWRLPRDTRQHVARLFTECGRTLP